MTEHIQFGSRKINFKLDFSDRKSLGITITPELEILVKAPVNATLDKIKEKVKKKAPWILKQESFFLSFHPITPPKKYISGETHLFLGRQYGLKIIASRKNAVYNKGRTIEVQTTDKAKAKQLLKQWYREKAKLKFAALAEPFIKKFKKYNVEPTGLYIQEMPKRWGSCTPKGKIILNPELMKAPRGCIEYVIVHELCHLVHHDHTQKFIDLQTREMPDWGKWKDKLEKLLA
jgi:predicted metal-dependent hydrolase